eukprot:m.91707 g.91707  ORF g.91707 m.91707 type:complete len:63 (+) comp26494_c0_seq1:563-751(+)
MIKMQHHQRHTETTFKTPRTRMVDEISIITNTSTTTASATTTHNYDNPAAAMNMVGGEKLGR